MHLSLKPVDASRSASSYIDDDRVVVFGNDLILNAEGGALAAIGQLERLVVDGFPALAGALAALRGTNEQLSAVVAEMVAEADQRLFGPSPTK